MEKQLKQLRFELTGYFIGGRTPRKDQMQRVEELRSEIAKLQKAVDYGC